LFTALITRQDHGTHLALAYQILAKSNNPRLNYRHLTLFNLSAVSHFEFD